VKALAVSKGQYERKGCQRADAGDLLQESRFRIALVGQPFNLLIVALDLF
jgi:hypothetical protein